MSEQIRIFLEWTHKEISHQIPVKLESVKLDESVADMTVEEESQADKVMKVFREEDRFV